MTGNGQWSTEEVAQTLRHVASTGELEHLFTEQTLSAVIALAALLLSARLDEIDEGNRYRN